MNGALLIVDEDAGRCAAFAERLRRRYHRAFEATDVATALAVVSAERPSLVLISADAPPPLGIGLCRRIKASGDEIAALLYTDGLKFVARKAALLAGADDVLVLPRDEDALMARLRSLFRLRSLAEELELRRETAAELGAAPESADAGAAPQPASVLIAAADIPATRELAQSLERNENVVCQIAPTGFDALRRLELSRPDAVIVSAASALSDNAAGFAEGENPVELIRAIASSDAGRRAPVLYLTDIAWTPASGARVAAALDAGAVDCACLDDGGDELLIRLRGHLRRKRYADRMRLAVSEGLRNAVRDPLTQLHNRRYLDTHFARHFARAKQTGAALSVLMFDLDHFKQINDRHGHAVGDAALIGFGRLLEDEVRVGDLCARYGGEEFVVVMPGAAAPQAAAAAERVRARVAARAAAEGGASAFTVSAGVASLGPHDATPEALIRRADQALLDAKLGGRDRVAGV